MKPLLIYCYDAYCGWCYGFSPVIKKLSDHFRDLLDTEVLSGGMILPEQPYHISVVADYISTAYKHVENTTGITFGNDFLWHIQNPDKSDWFLDSEKPAVALYILKERSPEKSVDFASDLQYALNYEGRDLADDEAYRHLLEKYQLEPESFFKKLKSEEYKKMAHEEFQLVKKLGVKGFPALLLQTEDNKIFWIGSGYNNFEALRERISGILEAK